MVALLEHELDHLVADAVLVLRHVDEERDEHADDDRHDDGKEDAERRHPFLRLGLFSINVLLERLEDGEVVHGVVLAVDADGVRRRNTSRLDIIHVLCIHLSPPRIIGIM